MGCETPDLVVGALRGGDGLSATELAARVGVSWSTARRHLGHLAERGGPTGCPGTAAQGGPEHEYRWR
ncbi:winged helix-turn-helix domain-containing protein [Modestobacter sp. SYSU DS0290]